MKPRMYIYKLYFTNGATYIGLHREKKVNDGYITSSSYYKKHPDLFDRREILLECQDNQTLEIMETIAILSDIASNPLNVNYNKGAWMDNTKFDRGYSGPANGMYGKKLRDTMSEEKWEAWKAAHRRPRGGPWSRYNKQKRKDANRRRAEINSQIRQAHQAAKINKRSIKHYWCYNPETRVETYLPEIPEGFVKGRLPYEWWPEERKQSYRKNHSVNAYAALSPEKYKEVCQKNREHQLGRIWITNGAENRPVYQGEEIPDGWRLGVTQKNKKKYDGKHNGDKAYTNGIKNIWVHEGDTPPEGYYKGWTKRESVWRK